MKVEGAAALVTGANRGLGAAIAQALIESGTTVYGAARNPESITDDRLIPVRLDVTNDDQIADAARRCGDVSIVVNNAGILRSSATLADGAVDAARAEMETNFFGSMRMARAFAPILRDNGGGALVNVLSVLSFISMPQGATYSASKAAAWSLTNPLRIELRRQGTLVVAVHARFIDTDVAAGGAGDMPFGNRGVGASSGRVPDTVEAMANDAITFIRALGFDQVDLLGFSLGGMIAQVIALEEPQLVRRLILTGTGPAGGKGIDK